jgi:hypothetical protein
LAAYFEEITKKGGEGAMLRKSGSYYEAGRSQTLKRLKVTEYYKSCLNFSSCTKIARLKLLEKKATASVFFVNSMVYFYYGFDELGSMECSV